MKNILYNTLCFLFITFKFNAQTLSFTHTADSFFTGVQKGNVEFVDIDGDNDMDILTTGYGVNTTNLYLNDGNGIYVKDLSIPFSDIYRSNFALADFDNDNDIDIIISGKIGGDVVAKVYENDGSGNFSLVTTSITGLKDPLIKKSDIEGDGDIDFFIQGRTYNGSLTTKLYQNNGNFNFVEISQPFPQSELKDAEFSDVDGDGDMDILMIEYIPGFSNSYNPLLFINDGNGNYTQTNSNLPNSTDKFNDIAFGDIDGDNDEDLLLAGEIYTNNGDGTFSNHQSLRPVQEGGNAFADIDNDGDLDLFYIGHYQWDYTIADLYLNDGNGNFTLVPNTSMQEVSEGNVAIADVNNDGLQDIFLIGNYYYNDNTAKLYINHGNENFSESTQSPHPFRWIGGDISMGDIDNDNDLDVIITGASSGGCVTTRLYTNNGNGEYVQAIQTPFKNFSGNVKMIDLDNDGNIDIFISGLSDVHETKLYKNDGNGNFVEFPTNITGGAFNHQASNMSFFDFEGDGDKDLYFQGVDNANNSFSKLYLNDGNGNFIEDTNHNFIDNLLHWGVKFFDIDNDGDIDILCSGSINGGNFKNTFIYENDGNQNFTLNSNSGITPLAWSYILTGDVDGDGLKDVYISGDIGVPNYYIPFAKMYHNNGNGTFTEISDWTNINVSYSGTFIDIDNDNDLDLFLSGDDKLYLNDGNGNFNLYTGFSFQSYEYGIPYFADIDGDNDLDLFQFGSIFTFPSVNYTGVIRNNLINNPPVPDVAVLPPLTDQCQINAPTPPTATDDIDGLIIGTTSTTFPITIQGNHIITWTFTDSSGNISQQIQNATIEDTSPPNAPTGLTTNTITNTTIDVNSNDATDNCTIDHYEFYLDTNIDNLANGTLDGTNTSPIYTYANLNDNTDYEFYSKSVDIAGNSSITTSNVILAHTLVGINNKKITGLKFYPNPATRTLHIEIDGELYVIEIYNLQGQLVGKYVPHAASKYQINLSKLTKGFYIVNIYNKKKQKAVKKLVII